MKKVLLPVLVLAILSTTLAFTWPFKSTEKSGQIDKELLLKVDKETEIKWYTWDEALEANKKKPKKMFIDMYTDWCGWCKRMDATTFKDPKVAAYLNENFYPVKFNAERKDDIEYKGQTFKYIAQGRRGVHELAYAILDGRLGYPAFVYLDEQQRRIYISPGYKQVDQLLKELAYFKEEKYVQTNQ